MQTPTSWFTARLILLGVALVMAAPADPAQPQTVAADEVPEPGALQEAGAPTLEPPEAATEPSAADAPRAQNAASEWRSGDADTPVPPSEAEAVPAPVPVPAAPLVGDAAAGATKAAVCGGCHGPDGNAPNPQWPKLAGQRPAYIAKQLRDFKAGRRVDPMMGPMAIPLSEQDIVDIAAHFASLEIRIPAAVPARSEFAERLYLQGRPTERILACVACHGLDGEGFLSGAPGGFPAIRGQNAAYLSKQLQGFRSAARTNDWEGVMQLVSANLTDADIAALVAYLSSMPRPPAVPTRPLPSEAAAAGGG